MINKKTILIFSGIISLGLFVLNFIGTFKLCGGREYGQCMDTAYAAIINLIPIVPLFVLALITYKVRDEIFQAWIKFSYVWIPLSMFAIFFAPQYSNDFMFPIVKGTVALFSSVLYFIISLIVILWVKFAPPKQVQ